MLPTFITALTLSVVVSASSAATFQEKPRVNDEARVLADFKARVDKYVKLRKKADDTREGAGGQRTHGSDLQLRAQLEPLFLKYGVDAVFSGHEHFYERIKPQKGIYYFVSGGAAKLRDGGVERSELTAKSFDSGYHFMLIEIAKDALHFQVISDQGKTVDAIESRMGRRRIIRGCVSHSLSSPAQSSQQLP